MKKKTFLTILALTAALSFTACGGDKEETIAETETITIETETETETETEEVLAENEMYSYLTGEIVDKSIGTQRPFAIMINNIEDAVPQSNISHAEIIYECLVEANITRLMCEFQDLTGLEKIGSVRSARHNYMDLADDDYALFTHYGQSPYARERMDNGYFTVNGMTIHNEAFYRTSDVEAPHNVFTSGEGLIALGLDRSYPEGYEGRLSFFKEDTVPENGTAADVVTIPFPYNNPWFEYKDGYYYRFQYGEAHMDVIENTQLKFKNLIIQYAPCNVISDEGHKDYELFGSGTGLIITNGKAVNIRWERATSDDVTIYYYEDGTAACLNPGNSYIALVPADTPVTCEAK